MSFNRLGYDTCAYEQQLNQAKGPGEYLLNVPKASCEPCYSENPLNGLSKVGSSTVGNGVFINTDVESDLKGQTRLASKCAVQNFMPSCEAQPLTHYRDCLLTSEETRTTNPPCNLRGTGWNRWEWLCLNPQDKVCFDNYPNGLTPFDFSIDSVQLTKDNHRPCLPTPLNQKLVLPNGQEDNLRHHPSNQKENEKIKNVWEVPTLSPPRNRNNIRSLLLNSDVDENNFPAELDNTYFKQKDFCSLDKKGMCKGSQVWEVPTEEPSVQWKQYQNIIN